MRKQELGGPIFNYEKYFRENVINLARRSPYEIAKYDTYIAQAIQINQVEPYFKSQPVAGDQTYRPKSQVYIYMNVSGIDEILRTTYIVRELHEDCISSYKLADHENCLIEYFDVEKFYSYMNGSRVMDWFNDFED